MAASEIRYETSDLKFTYPSLVTAAYVRVQIDSSNTSSTQMFAYVNDSTVTSIQPKTSIVRYKKNYWFFILSVSVNLSNLLM